MQPADIAIALLLIWVFLLTVLAHWFDRKLNIPFLKESGLFRSWFSWKR